MRKSHIIRTARRSPIRQGEDGSTLVEFGLVILLFMTMLLGIVEFSRALYVYHFVDHAAKTATRWAAVNGATCNNDNGTSNPSDPTDPGSCTAPVTCTAGGACTTCTSYGSCLPATNTDIENYVKMITPPGIDPDQVTTSVSWPVQATSSTDPTPNPTCVATQNAIGCTVEVQVSYPVSLISPLFHSGTITLSSSSEMVIAH
jgi:Flp pilus assembly protein TadG